jgi:uncharacterized protein (TIGR03066 family)
MKLSRIVASAIVVAGLLGTLQAEEKKTDNKSLIVGVWELTKADNGGPLVGTVMEYSKDGKIRMTGKANGKEFNFDGTYVVDGNKFTGILKTPDREEKGSVTIKKLTDRELVTEDDVGRVLEFKRKKK